MDLSHFRMLIHEFLSKYPDIVPEEAPLTVLNIKSATCIANNGKDTKHTRHIADLLSKTIKGASSGNMYGPLLKN